MTPEQINKTTRGLLLEFTVLLAREFPGVATTSALAAALTHSGISYQQYNKRKLDPEFVATYQVSCSTISFLLGLHHVLLSGKEPEYYLEDVATIQAGLIRQNGKSKTRAHTAVGVTDLAAQTDQISEFWQLWDYKGDRSSDWRVAQVPEKYVASITESIAFRITPKFLANRVSLFQLTKPTLARVLRTEAAIPPHHEAYPNLLDFLQELYARGANTRALMLFEQTM